MDLKDNNLLTPVLTITTTASWPERATDKDDPQGPPVYRKSDSRKVILRVCSEFTKHHAPVEEFYSFNKPVYLTDSHGQPMILSIDTQDRLVMVAHVDGAQHSWQLADLAPGGSGTVVEAFGCVTIPTSRELHVAAAIRAANGVSRLFHATTAIPSLTLNTTTRKIEPDLCTSFRWIEVPYNLGPKRIVSITCSRRKATASVASRLTSDFSISVGTAAQNTSVASFFFVDPSPGMLACWTSHPPPINVDTVMTNTLGAVTSAGTGTFMLCKSGAKTSVIQKCFQDDGSWLQDVEVSSGASNSLGEIVDMCACNNASGQTDLYVASDHGIGFLPARDISQAYKVIMPQVSFKQVFASEVLDRSNIDPNTRRPVRAHVAMVAVSRDDELFHIRGTRDLSNDVVTFSCSELAIRTGVHAVTCLFNEERQSHELIYATNTSRLVYHLSLDRETQCWAEYAIFLPVDHTKTREIPAYHTTVSVTDALGQSIGSSYPVELTGESSFVTVNMKTMSVDSRPKIIHTDAFGKINIICATDGTLAYPKLHVRLCQFDDQETHELFPGQRTIRLLGQTPSGDAIKRAISTAGKPVFDSTKVSSKHFTTNAESTADILSHFPNMLVSAHAEAAKTVLDDKSVVSQDLKVTWRRNEDGKVEKDDDASWLDKAIDTLDGIVHHIGDALEWVKSKFQAPIKALMRFGVKILAQAVDFVVEIGQKLVRFVVKTAGHLLRATANFLKAYLDIDISGLIDWLGLVFDTNAICETAAVLTTFATNTRSTCSKFFDRNTDALEEGIDNIKTQLQPYISMSQPPQHKDIDFGFLNQLDWLFHNPVLQKMKEWNPAFWLVDAELDGLEEGVLELVTTPDFTILYRGFQEVLTDNVESTIVVIWNIFADLWDKLKAVFDDPASLCNEALALIKDTILEMLDYAKVLIRGAMHGIKAFIDQTFEMLLGKWHLPFVTALFKAYTGLEDFSLMNVISFGIAQIMHIFFQAVFQRKPFEVLGDPNLLFEVLTDEALDVRHVFGMPDKPVQPVQPTPDKDGRTSQPRLLVTTSAFADPPDSHDQEYHKYRDIHNSYEPWLGGISTMGKLIAGGIGIFAYNKMSKNKLPPKPGPGQFAKMQVRELMKQDLVQQATIVMQALGHSVCLIGSLLQVAVFNTSRFSTDLSKEWMDDPVLKSAYAVPLAMNSLATLVNFVNYKFSNQAVSIVASCCVQAGDIPAQALFYLVHEPTGEAEKDDIWQKHKISGSLRITGDGCGIVSNIASPWKRDAPWGTAIYGVSLAASMAAPGIGFLLDHAETLHIPTNHIS